MTASILPFSAKAPSASADEEEAINQLDQYVGSLMSTAFALSASLLKITNEPIPDYVNRFIDDPELTAKVAAHREQTLLYRYLLAHVLLARAQDCLWRDLQQHIGAI